MEQWIDTHAHLDMEPFLEDLEQVIDRARMTGVKGIISVGSDIASSKRAVSIAGQYGMVKAAVGVHPHEACKGGQTEELERLLKEPEVLAVGEMGLDYFYNHSEREEQLEVFRMQVELAGDVGKPIIVHVRDAHDDAVEILRGAGNGKVRGVIHCFTGGPEDLHSYLEMGFYISFAGIVTFKKASELRDAAAMVPMDRLLVETDAPYLAPVPMRGKRNEPAFVVHTGAALAEVLGVSSEELASRTTANADSLFKPGSWA